MNRWDEQLGLLVPSQMLAAPQPAAHLPARGGPWGSFELVLLQGSWGELRLS